MKAKKGGPNIFSLSTPKYPTLSNYHHYIITILGNVFKLVAGGKFSLFMLFMFWIFTFIFSTMFVLWELYVLHRFFASILFHCLQNFSRWTCRGPCHIIFFFAMLEILGNNILVLLFKFVMFPCFAWLYLFLCIIGDKKELWFWFQVCFVALCIKLLKVSSRGAFGIGVLLAMLETKSNIFVFSFFFF
jgi:hypothetical protein